MFQKWLQRFLGVAVGVGAVLVCGALPALAEEAPTMESLAAAVAEKGIVLDNLWTLVTAMLVFFMQAGFAMVETGFTRAKNACNILMKNLMDFCFGTVAFWAVGFGVMFGVGNAFFGTSGFFLHDAGGTFASLDWTKVTLECKYFFQLVFAATAATIVSGAMAERTRFIAYIIYSIFISLLIYPVSGHWIWGGGWLAQKGMWDFAGSTVVHSVGGWIALVGAIMLGPRTGKYNPDGSSNAIMGHSIPLATLGVFILWLGWFGFNPGSTMAANTTIAHIAVTTNMAAAVGAIAAMVTSRIMFKKADISMSLNGALAGLVAITAPCAFVSAGSALWIGLVAGVLVVFSVVFIDKVLHIDDPVGAISVHAVNGVWGTLSVGLFAQDVFSPGTTGNGLLFGGGTKLLLAQLLGVVSVFIWCMITGFLLFYVIKKTVGLRVSRDEELRGLDIDEHGMEAYSGFQIFMTE
ncbi:MAG: ammonium transporter [Omnitrophica WOR_2 bacterium RIFCSPLOWO2_12_FULL_50_9]|nr:MAG: ammonium transporter [Omnitrophica WOR_2 bacterium RIFCSPHIGHO2_02_FULL_50_17]OGX41984.1 MAG: ammonium transporter [Omnitrophica WOR_2 bacterium RIFCSPLOWO2_12_FULL_50_9]